MNLDLSDDEAAALLRELDHIIDEDRFPLSPRIRTLTSIRDKLGRCRPASRAATQTLRASVERPIPETRLDQKSDAWYLRGGLLGWIADLRRYAHR